MNQFRSHSVPVSSSLFASFFVIGAAAAAVATDVICVFVVVAY